MQNPAASSDEVSKIVELTLQNRMEEAAEAKEEISRRDLAEFEAVIRGEMAEFYKVQTRHGNQLRRWAIFAWIMGGVTWPLAIALSLSVWGVLSPDPTILSALTFMCGGLGGLFCYQRTKE